MGIFDFVRNEFIDVIEWSDNTAGTMAHKYNMNGKEIMMGAQLTVRESQEAVFVNEGQLADKFVPGRYELQTANMPVMTKLKAWKFGFKSPFKADVYFVNTKQFIDRKWGTTNPVMMRDSEFGMIRLRGFGSYSFHVYDSVAFLRECFGTAALFTVDGVDGQIKRTIVSALSDAIAESKIPALDLAANYTELGEYVLRAVNPRLADLGLELTALVIENLSLPAEVEQAMDKRTTMGVLGDMNKYTQYQAAEALREAANNGGNSMAGLGVGMSAGAAMGQLFNQSMQQTAQPAPAAPAAAGFCAECGTALTPGAKFCPGCGKKLGTASVCPGCGAAVTPGAKFCAGCGQRL